MASFSFAYISYPFMEVNQNGFIWNWSMLDDYWLN